MSEDERIENGLRGLKVLGALVAAARLVVEAEMLYSDWRASSILGTAELPPDAVDALAELRGSTVRALTEAVRMFDEGDRRAEAREG